MKKLLISFLLIVSPGLYAEKIYIFSTQDFEPYSYLKNGNVSGPYAEIIQKAAQYSGIKIKFNIMMWDQAQRGIHEGKADGLFVTARNFERESWLYFSIPISISEYAIFVRKDNQSQIKSPIDLKDTRIGVYGPSNSSYVLARITRNVPGIMTVMEQDDVQNFFSLNAGKLDAVFSNRDVGNRLIKKHKLKLRYAFSYSNIVYYIAFSKQTVKQGVYETMNNSLKKMKESGELGKILEKYGLREVK